MEYYKVLNSGVVEIYLKIQEDDLVKKSRLHSLFLRANIYRYS